MALIKVEMSMPPVDGMDIKFKAPCDCTQITGLLVEYPEGSKEFTFRDCHGNNLAGIGNLFGAGAYIKVIVDVAKGYAYLQNADNNGFLNSAVFGTYTHDGENLTGYGENGKFKATTSGAVSTINVNGVACSVRCGEESSIDLIAGNWYTFILDGDTVNFSSGGAGGGGLNFRVIGNPPPASPKVNDIWIDTDVPITGYHFQTNQPENMVPGDVWIFTGTTSTVAFSATKKNPVMIYPLSAKQYIDGVLVDKSAKSWQIGGWVDWFTGVYLFNAGNQHTDLTGGWTTSNVSNSTTTFGETIVSNCVHTGGGAAWSHVVTKNKIDVTNYKKLYFDVAVTQRNQSGFSDVAFGIVAEQGKDNLVSKFLSEGDNMPDLVDVVEVNLEGYDGSYYVQIGTSNTHVVIKRVWLE